ncbi:hypothetical protein [Streptacidiphilus sp. PAMC 29251]
MSIRAVHEGKRLVAIGALAATVLGAAACTPDASANAAGTRSAGASAQASTTAATPSASAATTTPPAATGSPSTAAPVTACVGDQLSLKIGDTGMPTGQGEDSTGSVSIHIRNTGSPCRIGGFPQVTLYPQTGAKWVLGHKGAEPGKTFTLAHNGLATFRVIFTPVTSVVHGSAHAFVPTELDTSLPGMDGSAIVSNWTTSVPIYDDRRAAQPGTFVEALTKGGK